MRKLLFAALLLPSVVGADYTQTGNVLTFSDHWWQVERAWPDSGNVCTGGTDDTCTLDPGEYKWVGTTGEGKFEISALGKVPRLETVASENFFRVFEGMTRDLIPGAGASCPAGLRPVAVTCWAQQVSESNTDFPELQPLSATGSIVGSDGSCIATEIGNRIGQYIRVNQVTLCSDI